MPPTSAPSSRWTLCGPPATSSLCIAGALKAIAPVVSGVPSSPGSMTPLWFVSVHGVYVSVNVPPVASTVSVWIASTPSTAVPWGWSRSHS